MSDKPDITSRLLTPLLYLNLAGMAASALWLVSLSQWRVTWLGIIGLFLIPYLIPLLLLPAGILAHFMALYQNAGQKRKERLMYAASVVYIVSAVAVYGAFDFSYVLNSTQAQALYPALIWAAATSLAPFLIWSSGDRSNVFVTTVIISMQASMIFLCILRPLSGALPFWAVFTVLAGMTLLLTTSRILYDEYRAGHRTR